MLDELQEMGAVDVEAQRQLMDQLKVAKPEHYGLVVQQFCAALAYRRQLAERDAQEAPTEADAPADAPQGLAEVAADGDPEQAVIAAMLRRQQKRFRQRRSKPPSRRAGSV